MRQESEGSTVASRHVLIRKRRKDKGVSDTSSVENIADLTQDPPVFEEVMKMIAGADLNSQGNN